MCGSATLAMVVSSTCISMPSITADGDQDTLARLELVMLRRGRRRGHGCAAAPPCCAGWPRPVARVDDDVGGQAGDHRPARIAVERDPHRHALAHLDPIAVGVLRRQQREFEPVPAPMLATWPLKSTPG